MPADSILLYRKSKSSGGLVNRFLLEFHESEWVTWPFLAARKSGELIGQWAQIMPLQTKFEFLKTEGCKWKGGWDKGDSGGIRKHNR